MKNVLILIGLLLITGCGGKASYDRPIEENGGYTTPQEQEVGRLKKRLSTLRYLHKKTLRDADRLTFTDLGHSRHLHHHARWLEQQIEETKESLRSHGASAD